MTITAEETVHSLNIRLTETGASADEIAEFKKARTAYWASVTTSEKIRLRNTAKALMNDNDEATMAYLMLYDLDELEREQAQVAASKTRRLLAVIRSALSNPKAPLWAAGIAAGVAGCVLIGKLGFGFGGNPHLVTFDPVKFVNAQRAAASILATSPSADLSLTLTQVAKQSEQVIRDEAHGATVIVKQAVVAGDDIPDITDAVLKRFGLNTNVPTVTTKISSAINQLGAVAPTDSTFSPEKLSEDYREELRQKTQALQNEAAKQVTQESLTP